MIFDVYNAIEEYVTPFGLDFIDIDDNLAPDLRS